MYLEMFMEYSGDIHPEMDSVRSCIWVIALIPSSKLWSIKICI